MLSVLLKMKGKLVYPWIIQLLAYFLYTNTEVFQISLSFAKHQFIAAAWSEAVYSTVLSRKFKSILVH